MAQLTGIEWTDMSANPIRAVRKSDGKRGHACVHASTGCINCYSERWNGWRGTGLKFNVPSLSQVDIILDEKELARMRKIKAGNKVFVCDMTDLFGPFVPDEYIAEVFAAMRQNSGVTWQVLTKRPERMAQFFRVWVKPGYVYENVWLGTSVESQEYADKRIPELLKVPAAVRFLSCEPLLGPVNLLRSITPSDEAWECVNEIQERNDDYEPEEFIEECEAESDWINYGHDLVENPEHREWESWRAQRARLFELENGIHWCIVGGESGAGARPMRVDWGIDLMEQCADANVAFFWKQMGAHLIDRHGERIRFKDGKGGDWTEWPEELRVREFPDLVPAPDAGAVGEW